MLRSVCSHREEALEAAEWLLIETFSTAVVRTKVRKALRSWWKDRKLACFGAPSRDRRLPLIFRAVRGKLRDEIDSNPAIASRDLGWKIGRPLAPCMFHHTKRVLIKYRQQLLAKKVKINSYDYAHKIPAKKRIGADDHTDNR